MTYVKIQKKNINKETPEDLESMSLIATKMESLWQDTNWQNCGVKRSRAWAFCPQAVVGVLFLNMYTNSNTYQQNEIDIKSRKTILSDVKSSQIPVSVTKTPQNNYRVSITLKLHEISINSARPDWWVSWQDTPAFRTEW